MQYFTEPKLSRPSVSWSALRTIPFYPNNNTAIADGLTQGMLYAEEDYPHSLRAVVVARLFTGDSPSKLLMSGDGKILIPYVY